jgi:hypothetical protein
MARRVGRPQDLSSAEFLQCIDESLRFVDDYATASARRRCLWMTLQRGWQAAVIMR